MNKINHQKIFHMNLISSNNFDEALASAIKAEETNNLLNKDEKRNLIIKVMKSMMFKKSLETHEHAERIAKLTKIIGTALSLSEKQMNELRRFSILHDIGKININAKILCKQGKLNDVETSEMRKHSETGYRIISTIAELSPIADYILCHHERWDGKGYPLGLKETQIPLLSRILFIADSYDAMTNDRSYRIAMSKNDAIEEIRRNAGTQFDPEIAGLFIKIMS
ncbi:MAG: HD-GYP domain-containing protein [Saccharofermentanales bacterium]